MIGRIPSASIAIRTVPEGIWESPSPACAMLLAFWVNALAVLQNLDTYVNSEQEHIGITNVVLRLRQIFPDAAFTFCNRSGAGAQITIDFPYVPFFRIDG